MTVTPSTTNPTCTQKLRASLGGACPLAVGWSLPANKVQSEEGQENLARKVPRDARDIWGAGGASGATGAIWIWILRVRNTRVGGGERFLDKMNGCSLVGWSWVGCKMQK